LLTSIELQYKSLIASSNCTQHHSHLEIEENSLETQEIRNNQQAYTTENLQPLFFFPSSALQQVSLREPLLQTFPHPFGTRKKKKAFIQEISTTSIKNVLQDSRSCRYCPRGQRSGQPALWPRLFEHHA
jgi:hypothetical protein